ncbi:EAL domain-containing protein (putative c-di-GMP-specific phosphodiesterase class I) [Burkholderia ambifaria]|nr:EAL domain-containing protein [Burkholderia ambifaria]MDR6502023.1 EAL domain-containing protein (putative c-di-GMP-specific phosphodiesterase class I) [Burkholderia ambifaria]
MPAIAQWRESVASRRRAALGIAVSAGAASHSRQLVEGIVYLANKLGLAVVAEGVEEVEQREALKEIGIKFAQGFLFQRPAKILEFDRMYRHSLTLAISQTVAY